MNKAAIRFCYRKIITSSNEHPWDKLVFDDSYAELLMQFQFYNQGKKYTSFSELIAAVPAADKLHFLVSAAVINYIQQLGDKIPDITNNLGRSFLTFSGFRFEIINSSIRDKSKHQIAINFFSDAMIWHATIGSQLVVSATNNPNEQGEISTDLFVIPPFVSICSLTPIE